VASISTGPGGRRVIQFMAGNGKRKSIRLGKVSQRIAEEVRVKVEALAAAAVAGLPWDAETARWVAGLAPVLADKLAAVGLIPRRQAAASTRLREFLDAYAAGRTDAKASTITAMRTGADRLVAYFGADRELSAITPGDADDWARWLLEQQYAAATVGRTIKRARQFFRAAMRKKLIAENPFADVTAPGMGNEERKHFVDRPTAGRVLDTCPGYEWRLIFALSRFGGLRCPSEHLALGWSDVDWERGRFRVTSPKTERHEGKGDRWVPIFPELRPHLEEAFEQAPEGAAHVITRHRDASTNQLFRKELLAILRKAGVAPWPKLFHNLRASRETELAAEYPLHVVCAWIGNSAPIAAKHYLQVTDADFERAAKSGAAALRKPVQHPAVPSRTNSQAPMEEEAACELVRNGTAGFNCLQDNELAKEGLEPSRD
jgi:integrase